MALVIKRRRKKTKLIKEIWNSSPQCTITCPRLWAPQGNETGGQGVVL